MSAHGNLNQLFEVNQTQILSKIYVMRISLPSILLYPAGIRFVQMTSFVNMERVYNWHHHDNFFQFESHVCRIQCIQYVERMTGVLNG
jgi:hypothetical protein